MFSKLTALAATLSLSALSASAASIDTGNSANHNKYQPRPYKVNVSPSAINDIRRRAVSYHPVQDISTPPWFDGPPSASVAEVAKFISTDYDWFRYQNEVNCNFTHYMTTIAPPTPAFPHEQDIHFIHQKSNRKDATPIILFHGWPSTSLEWSKVIHELANPTDSSKPAFHVVAPDLPGYGFSPAPVAPGLDGATQAALFARLMEQLGYSTYALYSTDLGFVVAKNMAQSYADRIITHVTDFYIPGVSPADIQRFSMNQTTAEESQYIGALNAFQTKRSAYASVHSTYPLSIAHALQDSPMGFLAWMWELDYSVRDLSVPYPMSDLVSQALTLFLPGVYGNIRSYKELFPELVQGPKRETNVSTSILQFGLPKPSYPDLAAFNFAVRQPDFVADLVIYGLGKDFTDMATASSLDRTHRQCHFLQTS